MILLAHQARGGVSQVYICDLGQWRGNSGFKFTAFATVVSIFGFRSLLEAFMSYLFWSFVDGRHLCLLFIALFFLEYKRAL